MQIDWDKAIDEILGDKVACPRCGSLGDDLVAGYTREPWGVDYAPRCQFCVRKDDCDARKLVVLCSGCAETLRLRARPVDQQSMMALLINDCRKDLEEALDYLSEFWQEDLDVPPEDAGQRLEDFHPDAYKEEDAARRRLEDEYLSYHRWFRDRHLRVPDPGWRSEYAEEIIALGYKTLLGE